MTTAAGTGGFLLTNPPFVMTATDHHALSQPEPEVVALARPTDDQLIEEAIAVGLAFQPQDEVSEVFLPFDAEEPLDDLLVNFARAVLARYGHRPAPPAEGEVAELVALIRQIALAWEPDACLLGNMTAGQLCRAADLLEQHHPTPVPVCERDLNSILSPSGGYELREGAALVEGAQLIDGEWWAPVFGCDSVEHTLDRIRQRLDPFQENGNLKSY
jgi:hypothetical protein